MSTISHMKPSHMNKHFYAVIVSNKYRIECLSAATFPGAIKVIRNEFCQEEYVNIGTKVNKNPVAVQELLDLCAEVALDGISLVAVDLYTDEVAAVVFNKLQTLTQFLTFRVHKSSLRDMHMHHGDIFRVQPSSSSEKPFFEIFATKRCTQESSRALIKFMADIDGRCNLFEKYGVNCSFEIMFLATLRKHRKHKLGTLLFKYSIEVAKHLKDGSVAKIAVEDLGPQYSMIKSRKSPKTYPKICQAILTSKGSQKIGKVFNFTVHLSVPLKDFFFEGKSFTERIGDNSALCEVAGMALY